ncbi:hypothetical protein ES705_37209 [subsurface metagenome]
MVFKKIKLRDEFWLLKPKAKLLMCSVNWTSYLLFGKPIIITEIIYRGGTGVHADGRAFDIRTKDYYVGDEAENLKDTVNRHWVYDPKRANKKTCVRHKVKKEDTGKYEIPEFVPEDHLHFQVWIK